MLAYVYRPDITFDDTNVVGNVYFANFIRWQGACREMFLKQHAPEVLRTVTDGKLILHTTSVSCDYSDPVGVSVTDSIAVEMTLAHLRGGRMTVAFDYERESPDGLVPRQRIASGKQAICCKRPSPDGPVPTVFPVELLLALREFAESDELRSNIDQAIDFTTAHDGEAREAPLTA
jgi:enediyne core biosynthesis thioesterase